MGGYQLAVDTIRGAEFSGGGTRLVAQGGIEADSRLLVIAGVAVVALVLVAAFSSRDSGGGRRTRSRAGGSGRSDMSERGESGGVDDRFLDDLWHRAARLEDELERQYGALRSVDSSLAGIVARPSGIDVGVVRELTSLRNEVARLTSQSQQSAREARRLADALQG